MNGEDLTTIMVVAMDRMMQERDNTAGLDRAIETVVGTMGQFDGKDVSRYLEGYRAELLMRDVIAAKRLNSFARVVTPSLYREILEMIAESSFWEEFETKLLEKYGLDDSLQKSKKDLMDWVELRSKERNTTTLLQEFEKCFA